MWGIMCIPGDYGGLNIVDFKMWNKITMLNFPWNLSGKSNSLWVKRIHTYYLKKEGLMNVRLQLIILRLRKLSLSKETTLQMSNNYGINCNTRICLKWKMYTICCEHMFISVNFSTVMLQGLGHWWLYGLCAMEDWPLNIVCSTIAVICVQMRKP